MAVEHLTVHQNDASETRVWIEEALRSLSAAQVEIYENLRKDPYPRFLLHPSSAAVKQSENFKRLLAAEKLEADVVHSNSTHSPRHSTSGSSGGGAAGDDSTRKKRALTKGAADEPGVSLALTPRDVARMPTTQVVFFPPVEQPSTHSAHNSQAEYFHVDESEEEDVHPSKARGRSSDAV